MSDVPAASTTAQSKPQRTSRPRAGGLRRRLLRHYLPLAIASAAAMVLLMNVAFFDANRYPPSMEIMTEGIGGAFPGEATPMGPGMHGPGEGESGTPPMEQGEGQTSTQPTEHGADSNGAGQAGTSPMDHGGEDAAAPQMEHGADSNSAGQTGTSPMEQGEGQTGTPPMDHGGDDPNGAGQTGTSPVGQGGDQAVTPPMDTGPADSELLMRRYATATGYVGLGFLGLTLLVGPANLMLRRRTPLSSYLCRDVGIWAATLSIVHVAYGFLAQHTDGILSYFLDPGDRGRILTTSFGLANWAGLAAVVIVVGLVAISSDAALRKLKFRRWKRIQRLNYALFPLVIMHALLYGALKRMTSPYTALLIVTVIAVGVGQAVGVRLWRQRKARSTATASA